MARLTIEKIKKAPYKLSKSSSSGYKGVFKARDKWQAALTFHTKVGKIYNHYIGLYSTPEEAHKERLLFIEKLK